MNSIPYGRQHITEEDIKEVTQALQSDFLTQGPAILSFEKAFATYVNAKYAVAVSNGTAALHLAALALGVDEKSNVIVPDITFAASANCIKYCGGTVTLVDVNAETATIDLDAVEKLLSSAPAGTFTGIVPVDFAGYAVDTEKLRTLADKYGLWILEDACHAPGGYFVDSKGVKQFCGNGTYADLAIFSFHPVKHIACGEGGMITTNNKTLYEKLLLLRTHGITKDPALMHENHGGWYYEMQELGYNYRLTDFQAALGTSQLKRADEGLKRRREIASKYDAAFANSVVKPLAVQTSGENAYHLYVIQVSDRKGLYENLRAKNIYAQVHYIPVHMLPYYRNSGYKDARFPVAESYYEKCLSIPMYPTLTDAEQAYVIEAILGYY
ncbi:UDP-4-amino-4,6-dideoxy-N-acetyl-beta-L-altrosamine transaminase [Danxiaibacter flavus]|uniref:UDP-4-amino-4, 6-dideoxy-N-acetyl-beta-L-altrosamine transaminase n=1 Tax=Danxiaibacter flavus TaxID=3049108 RepID=A0ABV3ZIW5_9BACT|nr:UDP-4-amino-4,6-dideoxy-N-acetyl-beta-L-altrosamine transaminase [Chitinophagaceae bacterium DXS]